MAVNEDDLQIALDNDEPLLEPISSSDDNIVSDDTLDIISASENMSKTPQNEKTENIKMYHQSILTSRIIRPSSIDKDDEDFIRAEIFNSTNGHLFISSSNNNLKLLSAEYDQQCIFPKGTLSEAILQTIEPQAVLTTKEENEIAESKNELIHITKRHAEEKRILSTMLRAQLQKSTEVRVAVTATLMNTSDGRLSTATIDDIKIRYKKLVSNALEFIEFIKGKAAKLLHARQYLRAQELFKFAYEHSVTILGPDHFETLVGQSDYAGTLCAQGSREEGRNILEKTVVQLLSILSTEQDNNKIKRAIAIADYHLAQYYEMHEKLELATKHLDRSYQFRKEYGASNVELDKIKYLQAKIAFHKKDLDTAKKLFLEVYELRSSINRLDVSLIPVLEMLSYVMHKQNIINAELRFLTHLLNIQSHHAVPDRQIIATQLRILRAMVMHSSESEFRSVMENIEERLNNISVNKESVEVGLSYIDLADTRMSNLLPQDWSNVKKRQYFHETLKLLVKAETHFNSADNKSDIHDAIENTKHLKEKCQLHLNFFDDPAVGQLIGRPLHPEDEAEIKYAAQTVIKDTTSTEKRLKSLSEFSSEVRHSLVAAEERILTIEEFELLPQEGIINPNRLRTAQSGINPEFRDGKSLEETQQQLVDNPNYTRNIPPVEIGIHAEKVFSFDTRRLIVHQKARENNPDVYIRYRKIFGRQLQERIEAIFSSRPWNGIVTALRYGGKNSESIPYINPALRPQLEVKVTKDFKQYPNDRIGADTNGFPILKLQAKKIYNFLLMRANKGSTIAKSILAEAKKIRDLQGEAATYHFLIKYKSELEIKQFEKISSEEVSQESNSSMGGSQNSGNNISKREDPLNKITMNVYNRLIQRLKDKKSKLLSEQECEEIKKYISTLVEENNLNDRDYAEVDNSNNEDALDKDLTADQISVVSQALLEQYQSRDLVQFIPSVALHADAAQYGSFLNTINRLAHEQNGISTSHPRIIAMALNLSSDPIETRDIGNHWVYVLIILDNKYNLCKCLILNPLANNDYKPFLETAGQQISNTFNIPSENIFIKNMDIQHDDYNCGIWNLTLFEATLKTIINNQIDFETSTAQDIYFAIRNCAELNNIANLENYIYGKREQFNRLYEQNDNMSIINLYLENEQNTTKTKTTSPYSQNLKQVKEEKTAGTIEVEARDAVALNAFIKTLDTNLKLQIPKLDNRQTKNNSTTSEDTQNSDQNSSQAADKFDSCRP